MTNMKIALRKVHYSKALSQETAAFTADVYVDGKKRGEARNDGHGGMTFVTPHTLHAEIDRYAATLPPLPPTAMYPEALPINADLLVSTLLEEHLIAKDLRAALRRRILFTRADGKVYELRGTVRPAKLDAVKVLNDLPFEEALALYKAAS